MAIIHLSQFRLIDVSGEDAEKYLQGQVTADVVRLAEGSATLTAHCDPKGKVTGIFHIFKQSASQFYVVIRQVQLPFALEQLKKYAVFSKVSFNQIDAQLIGIIGEDNELSAQIKFPVGDRTLLINPKSAVNFNGDFQQWDIADIQQNYPILDGKNQGEFIPQAMNLQNTEQAISFSKGCYIGQETIARAKYRGTNKRAMYAFSAAIATTTNQPEIGSEIEMQLENGWRKTGTILSTVNFHGVLWLQVVLNQIEDEQQFRLPETGELLSLLDVK